MSQSNVIMGAIVFMYFVYITTKGELGSYIAVIV